MHATCWTHMLWAARYIDDAHRSDSNEAWCVVAGVGLGVPTILLNLIWSAPWDLGSGLLLLLMWTSQLASLLWMGNDINCLL